MKKALIILILLLTQSVWAGDFSGWMGNPIPFNQTLAIEEFIGGSAGTTATIGELGWSINSGSGGTLTVANVNSAANHSGIKNGSLNAVANGIGILSYTTLAGNNGTQIATDLFDMTWIIRPQTNTDQDLAVGIAIWSAAAYPPTHGIYFEQDTAGANPTLWQCVTRFSSTSTTTATAITVATNTWYKLRIHRNGVNNVLFYIDGVLVCTHTTNILAPTINSLAPATLVKNLAALAAKTFDLDYFYYKVYGLSR